MKSWIAPLLLPALLLGSVRPSYAPPLPLRMTKSEIIDGRRVVSWEGLEPPYKVQKSYNGRTWVDISYHLWNNSFTVPDEPGTVFYRVRTVPPLTKSVILAWSDSPGAIGYLIYYGTTPNEYDHIIRTDDVNQFTVSGLTVGTTYYFAIASYFPDGLASDLSSEISWTVHP